ncbi:hypothetical protein HMPREF1989_00380 [Porphyromonas gingivalis F0566]|nr:hypothetical protein HMPREF1989_00380 [Porphyromonas gingivalis F0566]
MCRICDVQARIRSRHFCQILRHPPEFGRELGWVPLFISSVEEAISAFRFIYRMLCNLYIK